MKILVLGHLAIDVDHRSGTEEVETTGGVFRSGAALREGLPAVAASADYAARSAGVEQNTMTAAP
jgi:hypothetical protein